METLFPIEKLSHKQEMVANIYKAIADKNLSFGCMIEDSVGNKHPLLFREFNQKTLKEEFYLFSKMRGGQYKVNEEKVKVIGHPINLVQLLSKLGDDFVYMNGDIIWTDGGGHFREHLCFWDIDKLYIEQQCESTLEDINRFCKNGVLSNYIRETLEDS